MTTNISTLAHFVCDVLSRLVALDEGDGLLSFQKLVQPVAREYEGTNASLLIAVALCGGILEFLVGLPVIGLSSNLANAWNLMQVRHTVIRVLGTYLVVKCLEDKQQNVGTGDSELSLSVNRDSDKTSMSTNVFFLLRRTRLLRTRVRRSISYAFAYSIASAFLNWLASSICASYLWLVFAEVTTAVLLQRIHLRWTHAILSRASRTGLFLGTSWRKLLLPTILYAIAQIIVAEIPAAVGDFTAGRVPTTDAVATRDIFVLASAFTLRFFVLYPVWASLISFEIRQTSTKAGSLGDRQYAYTHVLKLCYQKVLLRLAGLHLQAAGIMTVIEVGMYMIFHFLLHIPSNQALAQDL